MIHTQSIFIKDGVKNKLVDEWSKRFLHEINDVLTFVGMICNEHRQRVFTRVLMTQKIKFCKNASLAKGH